MGERMRIAVCGGVYSNPYALQAFCADAARRGAERLFCLGDLGGYGAEPDAVWPLLRDNGVECIAGNYDVAIAAAGGDCGCGYRDPRDQQYAQLMYDYTLEHTSRSFAAWMAELPTERRLDLAGCQVHLVHGSPLSVNDFWWESLATRTHELKVATSGADLIVATHSGLPWTRRFGETLVVNVGVIGRPANDGTTDVSYALIDIADDSPSARIVALSYDWRAQAASMRAARLPEAFVRTNEAGWWTTCLEVLPLVERSRGRYHVYDSSVDALLGSAGLSGEWPDDDPAIPVRSLVESPLLAARVWVDDDDLAGRLAGATTPWGSLEVARLGSARPGRSARGAVRPVEPTLTARGWFPHPDMRDDIPLTGFAGQGPLRPEEVTHALQVMAHGLLEKLHEAGALAPPRFCVPDSPAVVGL